MKSTTINFMWMTEMVLEIKRWLVKNGKGEWKEKGGGTGRNNDAMAWWSPGTYEMTFPDKSSASVIVTQEGRFEIL